MEMLWHYEDVKLFPCFFVDDRIWSLHNQMNSIYKLWPAEEKDGFNSATAFLEIEFGGEFWVAVQWQPAYIKTTPNYIECN